MTSVGVSPGDDVYADVWYTNTTAHFFVENLSTNKYTSLTEQFNGNTGQTAEWIVENPTINGQKRHLAFWTGGIHITDARAYDHHDGNYPCAGVQAHYYWKMYNSANNLLAYPGSWDNSTYCDFPIYRTGQP